ncbi:MAG TPA: N-acetylmuramoyl-L-alanine amidase [Fimbriimonas sp.]|nr:N-acetylmuramoyl-L-alanine amidase [Fimbriimonas sp.]
MFFLPAAPPRPLTICIDPGHPSEVGRGTRGRHVTEIQVAWRVAIRLKSDLEKHGVRVVMTKRTEEEFVRNRKRAAIANAASADLMVRLHCDSASGSGCTTYYPDQQGSSEGVRGPSRDLLQRIKPMARRFHKILAADLRVVLADNGLKGDEYTAVGRRQGALTGSIFSKVPVVLVEMVVLTNDRDEAFVERPAGLQKLAEALADASLAALEKP